MSDQMRTQPFGTLLRWIVREYEHNRSIFGIPHNLFYTPDPAAPYSSVLFGDHLATPIGPAAGPHTQMAQNIVSAWLCGGRFIELKTVQIVDELEIPRPCIDMADEGYNVEWSQELKLEQSAEEYVKAWVLIHVLRRLLGFEGTAPFGTILNMSVGYDLKGIQSAPMTRFMDRLADAAGSIAPMQAYLRTYFPQFAGIEIPTRLTNSVTLSTMHGCPPEEIEQICRYLLEERGLHTTVKLNPTLLGKETVLGILHDDLGFREIEIPDAVFAQDLQYGQAVELIRSLQQAAAAQGLTFGVKLSNTLAMANHKDVLPGDEVYMSGRALCPITINLFHQLAQEFDGDLNVSYSAGADALNVATILAAGARPVTAASDLLKPGGYGRLRQYLDTLATEMRARGAADLDELGRDRLDALERAAEEALEHPRYKKAYHPYDLPKVASGLDLFDCIAAPCVAQCAVRQDVPAYAWWIAQGDDDRALQVILHRNPLPGITGYVCTHLCQTRCTRSNYDRPVAIRALKRFAFEHGEVAPPTVEQVDRHVAIVGSGPSGLAAAYFLALNGLHVTIFEAKDVAGGMCAIAPDFRLPPEVVRADVNRIEGLGVEIRLNHALTTPPEDLLEQGFDAVYVAYGFQKDARLEIPGIEGEEVWAALDLLERVARGERPHLGDRVLVIGGGNTAMDAARTARRLTGRPATVVYRRTRAEMPAEEEELAGLLAEGNRLVELTSPRRVLLEQGRVTALECVRNRLGPPGPDGRRRPLPIERSAFQLEADTIIVAIGQAPDLAFLDGSSLSLHPNGTIDADPETGRAAARPVYAGGDAVRGPAIIIEACADGQRAAQAICRQLGIPFNLPPAPMPELSAEEIGQVKAVRARRELHHGPDDLPPAQRDGFALVEQPLSEEAARLEAGRCLQCATFCDKCVEVCPNRANYTYHVAPLALVLPLFTCEGGELVVEGEELFQVEQRRQIVHVADLCNACGNCATFCVHEGRPHTDKPRLFLLRSDFEREEDNAFYIDGHTIWRREGGQEACLTLTESGLSFESPDLCLQLCPDLSIEEADLKRAFDGIWSLTEVAEMALIWRGIHDSLPFLLLGDRGEA